MKESFRSCIPCGCASPRLPFVEDGFTVVRCPQCELVYVGEDPAQIDFSSLYGEAYYTGGSGQVFADSLGEPKAHRVTVRRQVWTLSLGASGGRLLDVGCVAGFFLAEGQPYYQVQGGAFSECSSRFTRQQLGLDVFTGQLQQAALPSGSFEVIALRDVIEHVPDPHRVLAVTARLLKPGGRLIVSTGDLGSAYARRCGWDWNLFAPLWHLYYFTRATLAALAVAAGLRVLACSARGVASDKPWLRTLPAVALASLFGQGGIMQMRLGLQTDPGR